MAERHSAEKETSFLLQSWGGGAIEKKKNTRNLALALTTCRRALLLLTKP